jgi:hypothetical protein
VPQGIDPALQRGDYIHPLYGLNGEVLTADYPADHPHHRGINWAWATIQWNGETRDAFAVRGIWARPVGEPSLKGGAESAVIEAVQRWMWDDKTGIVEEHVRIRAFRQTAGMRIVDFEIRLSPIVDGIEFCGRLDAGYSGFNVRMAPGKAQQILLHNDPVEANPLKSFADYSAEFSGASGRSGLAILQDRLNPLYPGEWKKYPELNFFQPAYPGGKLVPMTKGQAITLHYRLCVHAGALDEPALARLWDDYHQHVKVAVENKESGK